MFMTKALNSLPPKKKPVVISENTSPATLSLVEKISLSDFVYPPKNKH